jgi:hypothetical protein
MLGQAQEVFLIKAKNDKMKNGTLAKLAMQSSTFYDQAYEISSATEIFNRAWLTHMQAKKWHLACIAHYHKSLEAEENGKFGEQVGWIQSAQQFSKFVLEKNILKNLAVDSFESELKVWFA